MGAVTAAAVQRLAASQTIRFLLLGGFAAAVNWLVRIPLSAIMPFGAAVFIAYLVGMSVGFTLYRRYVFPGSTRPLAQQTALFLLVNAVGAGVVLVLAYALLIVLRPVAAPQPVVEAAAHGLAIGLGAVVNFLGHKFLTFAIPRSPATPATH